MTGLRASRCRPLPEQRRIVAKIDSLSGKSKRARDHLDHIPRLVEKYKQAMLAAAYRGARNAAKANGTQGEPQPTEVRNGLSKKPSDDRRRTCPSSAFQRFAPRHVRFEEIRYYPTTEVVPATAMLRERRFAASPATTAIRNFTAVCGMVQRSSARATTYPDKLIRVRLGGCADPSFCRNRLRCSASTRLALPAYQDGMPASTAYQARPQAIA